MKPATTKNHNPTFRRIAAALFLISVCLVAAAAICMEVQSTLRAYVGGEGLWSKGQKEAIHHLGRMAQTGTASNYLAYRAAIDIPLGDRQARLELLKPAYDIASARAGFLRGRNHPDDVENMIRMFRWFGGVSYMKQAIEVWTRADSRIEALSALGEEIYIEVLRDKPDPQKLAQMAARADALNSQLTPMEAEFSAVLGEASRAISTLLLQVMLLFSAILFAISLLALRMLLARNQVLQDELIAREEHYRSLFENSVDAVLLSSPAGGIHEANQAACRLFGYSEDELRAVGRYGIIRPDAPGLHEALAERERTGAFKGELEMLRKDGTTFPAELSSSVFNDSSGEQRGYLIVRDMSDRKEAERRLKRLNRFNTAFRRVSQAIARSREPGELYRELCNSAVRDGGLRMAGVLLHDGEGPMRVVASDGAQLGYFDQVIISAETDSPFGRGPAGRVVQSGNSYVCNDFIEADMGRPWREALEAAGFAAVAVFPLREHGKVLGILVLYAGEPGFFDQALVDLMEQLAHEVSFALDFIGEQKGRAAAEAGLRQLNQELEQRVADRTADLQASNKELGAFSYSVSHDLRGPLRAINGFAALLLTDHAANLNEEARDYLQRLRDASLRMDRLTNGLLQLAQLGRTSVTPTMLDLSAMARAVVQELRGNDPGREVEWVIAEGITAHADPTLMRSLLQNLLGNAWKFTGSVGHPRIEFGLRQTDGGTAYFVADNGCGFDMAYAAKIFGAFARLHAPHEYEGIGIGLATVKRILERHGGRVWVDAAPGQGATFYFMLPPA